MSAASPATGRRTLRLGRVLGVPVLLSPSWLLFAGLTVVAYGPLLARDDPAGGYLAAAAFSVLLLVSVVLHEVGHCVVARLFDLPVRSITVTFLAGLTEITEPPQTPGREYAVAVAGPAVSLLLAGVGVAGVQALPDGGLVRTVFVLVAISNGLVAVFNLLPGLPLDGGRVLKALLWRLTGDQHRATVWSAQAGRAVGLVVVPLVLLVALPAAGGRVTLVGAGFAALLAGFIYLGATASLQAARFGRRMAGVSVAGLAREALPVPADLPLAEALRRAHARALRAMVVVDATGRAQAVVSEASVAAVPEQRRPWVSVASTARRLQDGLVLDPSLAGEALLSAMRRTPATEYVAADPRTGELRVLVAEDVARAVAS